jgi:hypothetical protein
MQLRQWQRGRAATLPSTPCLPGAVENPKHQVFGRSNACCLHLFLHHGAIINWTSLISVLGHDTNTSTSNIVQSSVRNAFSSDNQFCEKCAFIIVPYICYSLRPLLPIANVDVSEHILVSRYIHSRDK